MRNMNVAVARELLPDSAMCGADGLETMSTAQLRDRYREVFKEDTHSKNRVWMRKRIQYRVQELEYGGLSQRAQARLQELLVDAPIRWRGPHAGEPRAPRPPRTTPLVAVPTLAVVPTSSAPPPPCGRDRRLPPPGTALQREYKNETHTVIVDADGFTFRGEHHDSLSKIARLITHQSWSGFAFFKLTKDWEAQ
jgi:hypothetical protein